MWKYSVRYFVKKENIQLFLLLMIIFDVIMYYFLLEHYRIKHYLIVILLNDIKNKLNIKVMIVNIEYNN